MFEEYIGKYVNITMISMNQEQAVWGNMKIIEVDGYLIKLENKQVINTSSPAFVRLDLGRTSTPESPV